MAEGVGFEPTVQLPVHGISSAAPSATRPPLRASPALLPEGANLAEGRGFEPPRDLRPYPISSRTPSTGLGHPSGPSHDRLALKNSVSSAAHSALRTPSATTTSWFSRGSSSNRYRLRAAPAFGSDAPYT